MVGLPASGKSSIATKLQQSLNAVLLDKDAVRACLFAERVDYERAQDDLCVNIMYEVSAYHFKRRPGTVVILDGRTYSRRYQVDAVKACAAQSEVPLFFLECVCCAQTAHHRLSCSMDTHPAKDRDIHLYEKSRAAAEPLIEPKLRLDTDNATVDQCVQAALDYIRRA